MISPQEFSAMTPHERREWFNDHPLEHAILQALARSAFTTDVDASSDAVAQKLDALGVDSSERNKLLADLSAEGRRVFPTRNPEVNRLDAMRLLDLMWLGALVHEYFDTLFPDLER